MMIVTPEITAIAEEYTSTNYTSQIARNVAILSEVARLRAENEALRAEPNPAVAAIQYVLDHQCDSPIEFLNCWMYGDFDAIRNEWEDVPDAVFIGADPLPPAPPKGGES